MIAPVIVCVVLTGMPAMAVRDQRESRPPSPRRSRRPGGSFVIRMPMVFTIRQPPDSVPSAIAACADEDHPERHVEIVGQDTRS